MPSRFTQTALLLSAASFLIVSACKDEASSDVIEFTDASLASFGCEAECDLQLLSPCTCGPDDPCGWQNDGFCDRKCLFNGIVENMFDDQEDCPGLCEGACEGGFYTECTCAVEDPCGWAGDDDCDLQCIEDNKVEIMFDDRADCPVDDDDAGV